MRKILFSCTSCSFSTSIAARTVLPDSVKRAHAERKGDRVAGRSAKSEGVFAQSKDVLVE